MMTLSGMIYLTFDLALCSHYLFLYSDHVDQKQHIRSMLELCRVAQEVRVYPLLSLDGSRTRHLEPVMAALREHGIDVSLKTVAYQFQKGATKMLVAKSMLISSDTFQDVADNLPDIE